ncbi:XAF1 factor, partial [Glaucidium brasilianum]|nr:XAF1 factor [Glaucidium brasilianum]
KRDVSAANFSLHEAHCLRFLTLCPECDEPVAQKDIKDHQTEAHKQARCKLCHQSMQQHQLEHHETKECQQRVIKCNICELEMPFNKLQEHLNTCASRTEKCWACNKYIIYKDWNKHKEICQNSSLPYHKDVNFQTSTGGSLCQKCNKSFPDDQYSQHLVSTFETEQEHGPDAPQPSSSLALSSHSENAMAWKVVRPKGKEGGQRLTSKTSLKPPKNKKVGSPCPASGGLSTSPQVLTDAQSFDMLATCAHCDILLPLPTLWKHEIKCLRLMSLKNARMKQKS